MMNERINELAEGCFEYIEGTLDGDIVEFNYKKFAELIVRECVICAEREWIRNGDTEHNRAVSKVIGSIKEHFGVEE
jgi:hypothetical protein